ncbi:MAG: M15 family metallopeptidase [Desulfobaccales bacterium]
MSFYDDVIKNDPRFRSAKPISDLALLEPVTRAAVQAIIADAAEMGHEMMAFETYRSRELQGIYFRRGVTKLQKVGVHHYGLAADIVKVVNGEPSWDGSFDFLGPLAQKYGMIWGGDWGKPDEPHTFRDYCHVQRVRVEDQGSLFREEWYPDKGFNPWEDERTVEAVEDAFRAATKSQMFKPEELALARQYLPAIQAAADSCTWPPELEAIMQRQLGPRWMDWVLCGIASRESRFGLLLDDEGLGDGGHGHGIMQVDDRSHTAFCAGEGWQDLAASLEYVHKNVIIPAFNYLGDYFDLFEDYGALFRGAIAGYNCGPGNVRKALEAGADVDARTTGRDYSRDVLARAKAFKEVLS